MNFATSDMQRGFLIGIAFVFVSTKLARWVVHRVTMARLRRLAYTGGARDMANAGRLEHEHCNGCGACLEGGRARMQFATMKGCDACGALLRLGGDGSHGPGERFDDWQACDGCGAPQRARAPKVQA